MSDADAQLEGGYGYQAGYSLAVVRDADGDGLDDLLVGATGENSTTIQAGAAFLVTAPTVDANLDDSAAVLVGEVADDYAGIAVSSGDLNGDGAADFAIGAIGHDASSGTGACYVVYGPATGTVLLSTADVTFEGTSTVDWMGGSVAADGDFDGDGYDDLVVAARSQLNIFYGGGW